MHFLKQIFFTLFQLFIQQLSICIANNDSFERHFLYRKLPKEILDDFNIFSGDGPSIDSPADSNSWSISVVTLIETKVTQIHNRSNSVFTTPLFYTSVLATPEQSSTFTFDFSSWFIQNFSETDVDSEQVTSVMSRTSLSYPGPSATINSYFTIPIPSPSLSIDSHLSNLFDSPTLSTQLSAITTLEPSLPQITQTSAAATATVTLPSTIMQNSASLNTVQLQTVINTELIPFLSSSITKSDELKSIKRHTSSQEVTEPGIIETESPINCKEPNAIMNCSHIIPAALTEFLIHTALLSNETFDSSQRTDTEHRLRDAFLLAYSKQMQDMSPKQIALNFDNLNITVMIHNFFVENTTRKVHIIYEVKSNDVRILGKDVIKVFKYITDDEMADIMNATIIVKAERFDAFKVRRSVNEHFTRTSRINWIALFSILGSLVVIVICLFFGAIIWCKHRNVKRKLLKRINDVNRVSPTEHSASWRKVTDAAINRKIDSCANEFEYVSFTTPKAVNNQSNQTQQKILVSKGIQSNIELKKEKVVSIGELSKDEQSDDDDESGHDLVDDKQITFISRLEQPVNVEDSIIRAPNIIEVRVGNQTQSIIRAIREELNRFNSDNINVNVYGARFRDSSPTNDYSEA